MKHSSYAKFRRLLALLAALVLIAGLAGCRKDDESGSSESTPPPTPSESTAAIQDTTVPETTVPPTVPETTTLETEPSQDTVEGTVLVNELNIRKGAGTGYEKVGAYGKSERISILEINEDWGRTDKGWINLAYVKLDNDTEDPDTKEETDTTNEDTVSDGETKVLGYGVVNLGALNVRTGPGTKYDQVDMVALGERYAYYQKSGNWIRIDKGWVSANYMYLEGNSADGAGTGTLTSDLNIRTGPGKDFDKVGTYRKGDTVKVLAQVNSWGYTGKGWISMAYVKMDGTTDKSTTGTITADSLHIRKEATKESDSVGTYKKGDTVKILETKDNWGRTSKGWISMNYVELESKLTYKTGSATVNASILNIRKSGSLEAEKVGTYEKGQTIEILEVKGEWGRTDKGWVAMEYVAMK